LTREQGIVNIDARLGLKFNLTYQKQREKQDAFTVYVNRCGMLTNKKELINLRAQPKWDQI
jgi:hypothetical protein